MTRRTFLRLLGASSAGLAFGHLAGLFKQKNAGSKPLKMAPKASVNSGSWTEERYWVPFLEVAEVGVLDQNTCRVTCQYVWADPVLKGV